MALRSTTERWGAVAKLFHWVIAALVLFMIVIGLSAVNAPLGPAKLQLFTIHKLTGLSVFLLMIARLAWRLANPTPILPPTLSGWERTIAKLTHWLLYGLVLSMPISGYAITSAANFPISAFGMFEVPLLIPPNKETQELAESVHGIGFYLLAALIVLHAAAALRHQFILKDDILKRMLPGA